MRKYKIAAILQLIQGALMELPPLLAVLPLVAFGVEQGTVGEHFAFIVPYLQDNLYLMMAMGGIFGIVRIIGAIGLLRNRMWGLALTVINCVVTMGLMIFMLPAGIADGILACTALILILLGYFGNRPAVAASEMAPAKQ